MTVLFEIDWLYRASSESSWSMTVQVGTLPKKFCTIRSFLYFISSNHFNHFNFTAFIPKPQHLPISNWIAICNHILVLNLTTTLTQCSEQILHQQYEERDLLLRDCSWRLQVRAYHKTDNPLSVYQLSVGHCPMWQ